MNDRWKWILFAVALVAVGIVWWPHLFPARSKGPPPRPPTPRQEERFRRMKEAAEKNDLDSQLQLAWMYEHGRGVKANPSEAARWYETAVKRIRSLADRDDVESQVKLGWMYQEGFGVERDHKQAGNYFRMAAEKGNAAAQYNLGLMYNSGVGQAQNYAEAYKWYTLAIAGGNPEATGTRSMMAKHMSPDQVADGQKRADEFAAKLAAKGGAGK